jgi:hypothetical protein
MKVISRGSITIELTHEECIALKKLIGSHSTDDDLKHGLTQEQSNLTYDIYDKLYNMVGE